jgi:hypothetical protein
MTVIVDLEGWNQINYLQKGFSMGTVKEEVSNYFISTTKYTQFIQLQFILAKLYSISITSLFKNHRKALIFSGII